MVRAWLTQEEQDALASRLPSPLYVWGFDSV